MLPQVLWLGLLGGAMISGGVAWGASVARYKRTHREPHWDWSAIDLDDLSFPPDFLWGIATAAHQVEGDCTQNNWARWEKSRAPDGSPRIADGQVAGSACEHWTRYRDDIARMKELGVKAYRFSVEWSKIEPEPGLYDQDALDHYHEVIEAVHEAGLTPMITLHHFSHPLWFEALGSFEKSANIDHVVRFAKRVFQEYRGRVRLWCTLNEPAVFGTSGWFQGVFPPGKQDPQLTARVLANLVSAHGRIYRTLKSLPGGGQARIGLVKNIFQFDPARRENFLDWQISLALDRVFNGAILNSLRSGTFDVFVPGLVTHHQPIPEARNSLDFIGLNYYSHLHVKFQADPSTPFVFVQRAEDTQTDMPYPLYAEGFHRALHRIGKLGVPVYVTENGIADAQDDRRETFIRQYLYALSLAIREGVDVRGYFYWTLMDNFEWAEGYHMKFGLYALDRNTQERTLREGARAYSRIIRETQGDG